MKRQTEDDFREKALEDAEFFFRHEFWQLAKADDGRAMLFFTEDMYERVRATLKPSPPDDFIQKACSRYLDMLGQDVIADKMGSGFETAPSHLAWMLEEIPKLESTKAHRWLGFVQGVLIMARRTTVEIERNATRELLSVPAVAGERATPKGENEYGLDVDYFNRKLSQIVRDVRSYAPAEMARALARLVVVADESVLSEPEFSKTGPKF